MELLYISVIYIHNKKGNIMKTLKDITVGSEIYLVTFVKGRSKRQMLKGIVQNIVSGESITAQFPSEDPDEYDTIEFPIYDMGGDTVRICYEFEDEIAGVTMCERYYFDKQALIDEVEEQSNSEELLKQIKSL